jgi:hypothetical protein
MSVTVGPSDVPADLYENHEDLVAAAAQRRATGATADDRDVATAPSRGPGLKSVVADLEPADLSDDPLDISAMDAPHASAPAPIDDPPACDWPAAKVSNPAQVEPFTPAIPTRTTTDRVADVADGRAAASPAASRAMPLPARLRARARRTGLVAVALLALVVLVGTLGSHRNAVRPASPGPAASSPQQSHRRTSHTARTPQRPVRHRGHVRRPLRRLRVRVVIRRVAVPSAAPAAPPRARAVPRVRVARSPVPAAPPGSEFRP